MAAKVVKRVSGLTKKTLISTDLPNYSILIDNPLDTDSKSTPLNELKTLFNNATIETDPIFSDWIDTTPPAYPGDIPDISGKANLSGADFTGIISIKGTGTNKTNFETAQTGDGVDNTVTFPTKNITVAGLDDIPDAGLPP